MRIALLAPLHESVPPKQYGGTERIVAYLADELVDKGHEVTLFASGDSSTKANLVSVVPRSLRLDSRCIDPVSHHLRMCEMVYSRAREFDVIHSHIDYFNFSLARRCPNPPTITTLHGRLDIPDLSPLYDEFSDIPVLSISDSQREPLPQADWRGTVAHGLPTHLYRLYEKKENYLAFLGRVSPEKRLDRAIQIARRVGIPLKVAAKVDKADTEYYQEVIRPQLEKGGGVEFIGEIGESEKNDFLGKARALLFPIDWPEPFGLVMIEAMACGTPVVAFRNGSVPEVMTEGRTGFIVDDIEGAIKAVHRLSEIPPSICRETFEARFTASRMADDYVKQYEALLVQAESKVGAGMVRRRSGRDRSLKGSSLCIGNVVSSGSAHPGT